ncbi:Bifunctional dihydrofolate reductase-thymidylate synthase [Babesia sp. Xinjiang]|uniref:Bifunctional dihydrofolate reductase-thymidylate synthase n=1 Tax=Babesia sp. Xinjiang TaxID=462227 RepID=UPI000A25184A|nr:Bifunctional dihydrofolate reductase-thymidylate synthase [Babesia sp. Xinjiang]ORM41483.1 Bifunctional dihydrofolate reductase-thymidylate synthase [Babesia sp. Xinjiang]
MGGAGVYREALENGLCSQIYVTRLNKEYEGDTFFPKIPDIYEITGISPTFSTDFVTYDFVLYEKKGAPSPKRGPTMEELLLTGGDLVVPTPKYVACPNVRIRNHEEFQYLDILADVLSNGTLKPNRTGVDAYSKFGYQMRFDLSRSFPLLTTKKVALRSIIEELLWFIKGSTNGNELLAKNVRIWELNGNREFLDKNGFTDREEHDLGPIYGFQWRHFGAKYENMHADYAGQGIDQLATVINRIKTNPNDRRMIVCSWNVSDLKNMALPPCHCLFQFYVRDGKLSCMMHQRSCDLGLGVPFNIASYSILTAMIAQVCGLKLGEFVHNLADAHIYVNHVDAITTQISRVPHPFPRLRLNPDIKNIEDFKIEDIVVEDYRANIVSCRLIFFLPCRVSSDVRGYPVECAASQFQFSIIYRNMAKLTRIVKKILLKDVPESDIRKHESPAQPSIESFATRGLAQPTVDFGHLPIIDDDELRLRAAERARLKSLSKVSRKGSSIAKERVTSSKFKSKVVLPKVKDRRVTGTLSSTVESDDMDIKPSPQVKSTDKDKPSSNSVSTKVIKSGVKSQSRGKRKREATKEMWRRKYDFKNEAKRLVEIYRQEDQHGVALGNVSGLKDELSSIEELLTKAPKVARASNKNSSKRLLATKLRNKMLVIVDDDIDTESMVPDVKYLRLSDVYAQSIYRKSLSLNSYLSLVESLGKERSDYRIQEMLSDQSKHVGTITRDSVMMITFSSTATGGKPRARKVTYGEMASHFKALESMKAWSHEDVLVVFMTNPTYDFFTSIVLYYCFSRGNVRVHFLQRYMSTYWKILWEANEHAKNVFSQLGKNYKILSFLFPRQLEALLTLDEVAQECKIFGCVTPVPGSPKLSQLRVTADKPCHRDTHLRALTRSVSPDDADKYATPRNSSPNELPIAGESGMTPHRTPSRLSSLRVARAGLVRMSKYIWGSTTAPKLQDTPSSAQDTAISSGEGEGPTDEPTIPPTLENSSVVHRSASVPRTESVPRNESGRTGSLYIPKLHLKFTELRNVLCDKNVYFLLSGTHASIDLCRLFARLTAGKTPISRYGCTEVSPTVSVLACGTEPLQMALVDPELNHNDLMELYSMGITNSYNERPTPGQYIGTSYSPDLRLSIVKSVDKMDPNFMAPCSSNEPGYFVCNVGDGSALMLPHECCANILEDGTYLGICDVGFFIEKDKTRHFYWSYKVDTTLPRGFPYPYFELIWTSRLMQQAICTRYDLTEPVVRVETVYLPNVDGNRRIICAVELITSLKSEIATDLKSTFLDLCSELGSIYNLFGSESVGMFLDCVAPDEIRVVSIPWAYKGSVSYPVLRVRNDSMSPVLFALDGSNDLALVIRANRYYRNDVVLYQHPVTGDEAFGRLLHINATDDLKQIHNKVPCGHCWVENDNPRSDEPDSREFGAIPLGLLRGCVLATIYPVARAKVLVS